MVELELVAKMSFLWGAILYQWASSIFLIVVNDQTELLSAIFYLVGSGLFAMSDVFRICDSTGFSRLMNCTFCFADSLLTIGSIFFFPSLNKVIVGNWIFEIAGWLNCINHTIMWITLLKTPNNNRLWPIASRLCNHLGACLFIAGNILLINNKQNFYAGFDLFTIGSVGFTLGACFSFFIKDSE